MAPPRLSRQESFETARDRLARKTVLIPFSDCHYFDGTLNEHGYGTVRVGGKNEKAHRVAYELVHGPIPQGPGYHGTVVRHSCDEPSCVNPDHLTLGSQQDNLRDKLARGRQYGGEGHHFRKLSDDDVRSVKRAIARFESPSDIAKRFGVHQSTISQIKSGRLHRNIAMTGGSNLLHR